METCSKIGRFGCSKRACLAARGLPALRRWLARQTRNRCPPAGGDCCSSMADEVPRAVHSAPKPCARSSASTEHAPATVGANSTSADVEAIDDGPAVRGPEAARTNLVSMESSQAASSSSDRHEIHPTRGAASVSRQAECFSVAELKERALHMFVAAI